MDRSIIKSQLNGLEYEFRMISSSKGEKKNTHKGISNAALAGYVAVLRPLASTLNTALKF